MPRLLRQNCFFIHRASKTWVAFVVFLDRVASLFFGELQLFNARQMLMNCQPHIHSIHNFHFHFSRFSASFNFSFKASSASSANSPSQGGRPPTSPGRFFFEFASIFEIYGAQNFCVNSAWRLKFIMRNRNSALLWFTIQLIKQSTRPPKRLRSGQSHFVVDILMWDWTANFKALHCSIVNILRVFFPGEGNQPWKSQTTRASLSEYLVCEWRRPGENGNKLTTALASRYDIICVVCKSIRWSTLFYANWATELRQSAFSSSQLVR